MKTALIPQVRVEPTLRAELDAVLAEDETLSEFVEAAVRRAVERRRVEVAFLARGQQSSADAQRTGVYHSAAEVHDELQRRLDERRKLTLG